MKYLILILFRAATTFSLAFAQQTTIPQQSCREQLFKITAYYSPVENQLFYLRPNLSSEIRLNGRGVNGASGKPVFDGMIAAPRSYEFGSQIILPGLGIGEVADRGGAIVAGSGVDRLDIWAGKGDIGLERAKSIGHITMTGFVCSGGTMTEGLGINRDLVPDYQNFIDVAVWSIDQSTGRADILVKKLQEHFFKLGYADDFTDGVYDDKMANFVCRFQQDALNLSGSNPACGVFGPQTRATLMQKMIQQGLLDTKRLYQTTNFDRIHSIFRTNRRLTSGFVVETNPETKKQVIQFEPLDVVPMEFSKQGSTPPKPKTNQALTGSTIKGGSGSKLTVSTGNTKKQLTGNTVTVSKNTPLFTKPWYVGEKRNDVRDLKMILKREKLYIGKIDKTYDNNTRKALAAFQKKYKLIDDKSDPSIVGVAGPATRALLEKKR